MANGKGIPVKKFGTPKYYESYTGIHSLGNFHFNALQLPSISFHSETIDLEYYVHIPYCNDSDKAMELVVKEDNDHIILFDVEDPHYHFNSSPIVALVPNEITPEMPNSG
ncbi:hypothetical protein JTB14_022067 [Gonioctena quinquepunctata]|nr:hypothetical protein JTB14_022067 [Gonioctena quinquepunctata]